jgi:hypothetical protein
MAQYPKLPEEYEEADRDRSNSLPCHEVQLLKGHEGPVFAVRYNRQGTYCVSCGKVRCAHMLVHRSPPDPPCVWPTH